MAAASFEEEWDFYPCRVDDGPASISLNLWFEANAPVVGADTLYFLRIEMLDKAEHGLGSSAEADLLHAIEDQLCARARASGFLYVGRLRNGGVWQLTFYGARDRLDMVQELAARGELDGRDVDVGSQPDPDWDYYREFLLPDAERRQWMHDRRVVEVLAEHGDRPQTPRRVDHWAYFSTTTARDAFVRDAIALGFALQGAIDDAKPELTFGAQVHRVDAAELDHIHEVVMGLVELAEQHGGDYDGWETSVEKPSN